MLNAVQKSVLIPVLTLSAGFFISTGEPNPVQDEAGPYPDHLVGAFTGGFGEETCHSCHFDYDLNWEEGELSVQGIPKEVQPGMVYEIEIKVKRKNMGRAGFQMSSRFRDGTQAGSFQTLENERLMFTEQVPDSIQFLQHSNKGTELINEMSTQWIIQWKAPDQMIDSIYFNISANAANGDESEFGDWIYVQEIKTK